jgi:hypothetical protein
MQVAASPAVCAKPHNRWKQTCRAFVSYRSPPAPAAFAARAPVCRRQQRRRGMAAAPRAGASDVFVLDFDGALARTRIRLPWSRWNAGGLAPLP